MTKPGYKPTDIERLITRQGGATPGVSLSSRQGYAFVTSQNNSFLASNAYFDGTSWNRYDTSQPAALISPEKAAGNLFLWTAPAGANPIVWTQSNLWVAPSLATNWSNFGGTNLNAGYMKDQTNRVWLRGTVKKSIAVVGGETLFTLPVGFRPSANINVPVVSNSAFGYVAVSAGGVVSVQVGNATFVALDGISFDTQ